MKKIISSALLLVLMWAGYSQAEPVIDEDTLRSISAELIEAATDGNVAPFKKYLYEGSEMVVDLDPSPSAGEMAISYDEYVPLLEMAIPMMKGADLHVEVLSVSIDEAANEGTIREKSTSVMEMMGTKIRDVSISESTYGVVNGQIKLLRASDQVLSSGPVQ
ncbi:MAG: hypothetical protein AAF351_08240 [Pseudomonadota bacterium]